MVNQMVPASNSAFQLPVTRQSETSHLLYPDCRRLFLIKIREVRNEPALTFETTISTDLLFMCTLDHLGKMRSFKQQRHYFSLFDPNNALNLTVKRHASTRLSYIGIRQLGVVFTPLVRGVEGWEATQKSRGPSLKMSVTEVLWASPSPTFTNLLLESET